MEPAGRRERRSSETRTVRRNQETGRIDPEHVLLGLGVFIALAAGGVWLAWRRHHSVIAAWIMREQHLHMIVFRLFTHNYDRLDRQVQAADPASVTAHQLVMLCWNVGSFTRWIVLAPLLAIGLLCLTRAGGARFTRKFDLAAVAGIQSRCFATGRAFVGLGLTPVAPGEGRPRLLDPPLHPAEWATVYALSEGRFSEARARAALAMQLGSTWRGLSQCAPACLCLALAFDLHRRKLRSDAVELIGALSTALQGSHGPVATGPVEPVPVPADFASWIARRVATYDGREALEGRMARHAYQTPALMSLLMEARRDGGVLNPALFACLRLVDRLQWLALSSLGFPYEGQPLHQQTLSVCTEALGVVEHWRAECVAAKPLPTRQLGDAILCVRKAWEHPASPHAAKGT